jgi:hypothetical protein
LLYGQERRTPAVLAGPDFGILKWVLPQVPCKRVPRIAPKT